MQCEKHPGSDVVGTCVSCGRPVCEECKVRMNNLVHCKECVEAGRIKGAQAPPGPPPMYAAPPPFMFPPMRYVPRPKGDLRPYLFRIGGIGAFLAGITIMIMGACVPFWNYDNPWPWGYYSMLLLISVNIIFLFILTVGCYGIYWNYGSLSGLVGIFGVLVMGPFIILVASMLATSYAGGGVDPVAMFENSPIGFLYGITMTLVHLSVAHARHYIPVWHGSRKILGMARATNIVGTAFFFSIFLFFVGIVIAGYFIVGAALIMFAIFFLMAPMPGDKAGSQGAPS